MESFEEQYVNQSRLIIDWKRLSTKFAETGQLSHEAKLALAVQLFRELLPLCERAGVEVQRLTAHDFLGDGATTGLFAIQLVFGTPEWLADNGSGELMAPFYGGVDSDGIIDAITQFLTVPLPESVTDGVDSAPRDW